ncbi:MAG: MCE family protein [Deltaproteobacteria bacterium]|nr:MCE family protein [Deltaproteobacteria bacterium]
MASAGTEIKVGLFVFAALVGLTYMTTQVSKGKVTTRDMYDVAAYFDNVSGLKENSPVEIAGIDVGLVKTIGLEGNRAKVIMAVKPGVVIHADAQVAVRTRGVLGDKFVEIVPGSSSHPVLTQGGTIARSETPPSLEDVLQKVGQIADDVGLVARSVSNVLGGEQGEQDLRIMIQNMRDMAVGLNGLVQSNMDAVGQIVGNLRDFSADLKQVSGANKDGVDKIVKNLEVASAEVQVTLKHMNVLLGKLHEGEGPMGRLVSDQDMGQDLKETLASLQSVSRKIDEGKGTIGRLINDDTTAEELDKALEGINKYLAKQDQFRTSVEFSPEYMSRTGDFKSYLNLKLQPAEDKYYMLSLISDPSGKREKTTKMVKYRDDGGAWHTYEEEKTEFNKDKLKFSAQIAKRWDDVVLRGGIIESSGGFGVDYYLWDDRLQFFVEAFDFRHDHPPHLKGGGKLYFMKNFYLSAGMDDFISDDGQASFFSGLGFYFTDEDLKYILGSAPLPMGQ